MPPQYNEADTRAKLIDPALHACSWIELVKDEQRATHGEIHREQSAVRIDILDGNPVPGLVSRRNTVAGRIGVGTRRP